MKNKYITLLPTFIIFQILREISSYNNSIPFNFSQNPEICYVEDFELTMRYRPFLREIYPIRGCNSDERNRNYNSRINESTNIGDFLLTNITYEPRLDYFFNKDTYPPQNRDPPTSMTFRIVNSYYVIYFTFLYPGKFFEYIYFGRSDDYHPIPKISKRTGKPIQFIGNKAILPAKVKIVPVQFHNDSKDYNFSYSDYEIYDYEGKDFNATFDGYCLNLSDYPSAFGRDFSKIDIDSYNMEFEYNTRFALIFKVYDLPRMKVQGLFQYKYYMKYGSRSSSMIYTVDTRNVFFQNISMFYNQRVNVTNEGLDPTGEDTGFWVKTPCNQIQMATILVDYHFFDTIHRMQSYGYEFGDRFQLRIHTPYYRKTLGSEYSLFRSQWNETYPPPRVFIHPIYKYKEYCDTYKNCTKFDYDEWSTDPKFTKYIIDIENEIIGNEIRINFTELERIYEADGFHRGKLSINVNNTMTPHITHITNGLWAELVDLQTNDWVMKTKTIMDEVHGYTDDYEDDPFRNFYLTCEIPDNFTSEDFEIKIKKYGMLGMANIFVKLDVFSKGITKLHPPRFNAVFKFPPDLIVNEETTINTYMHYYMSTDVVYNYNVMQKDIRLTGIGDGTVTNDTIDIERNQVNVSELHHNHPLGDDTEYWCQHFKYNFNSYTGEYIDLQKKRLFLYYFLNLHLMYAPNNTKPIDITTYYVRYVPYHAKNQINRGLHRWNPHHAGWFVPEAAIQIRDRYFIDYGNPNKTRFYRYYFEDNLDNFWYRELGTCCYVNGQGSQGAYSYSGPDCIFSPSGGSTMRNTSCEYWNDIIPEKPFTNYARDIYEEHVAYRTLHGINEEKIVYINSSDVRDMYNILLGLSCGAPGRHTFASIFLHLYTNAPIDNYEDRDDTCYTLYEPPQICYDNCKNISKCNWHFGIYNVHQYPEDYFTRVDLPNGLIVIDQAIGKTRPCYDNYYTYTNYYQYYHQMSSYCYYKNSSTIYSFGRTVGFGTRNELTNWDVKFTMDAIYYQDNASKPLPIRSGLVKFGFYDNPFYYGDLPRNEFQIQLIEIRYINVPVADMTITRDNLTNDGMTTLNITFSLKNTFSRKTIFIYSFSKGIHYMEYICEYLNGKYYDNYQTAIDSYSDGIYIILPDEKFKNYSRYLRYDKPVGTNISFYVKTLFDYYDFTKQGYNEDLVQMNVKYYTLSLKMINYRAIKPIHLHTIYAKQEYDCVYFKKNATFTNIEPQILLNMTVTPNSYFTNDRAVYKFDYTTYMRETLIGDVFIYKSSWKTKYNNNEEDPDENGYYINKIYIDRNYSTSVNDTHMTLVANIIINPETTETQYIKDIHMVDYEGYLLSVCNDIIPIKMKKIIGFKRTEVQTEKTDNDNLFNINFDIVPEVLIKTNDKLKLKFSSLVSLKDYQECNISSEIGLSILSPDFQCEIDIENNQLILSNAFQDIGKNQTVFENLSSIPIIDQHFKLSLKNIPMFSTSNDLEDIYSIEIKTESDGVITQKNLLPSNATFYSKCDGRCKTCNESSRAECITCSEKYPYYYPNEKYCNNYCPKEKYYQRKNENGNIDCLFCEYPCENCIGTANNCTLCAEGYFMENNICVNNCSEGYDKDFILRKCYPIPERNKTVIVDRTIYINVSFPDFYPVYIERNICMIE